MYNADPSASAIFQLVGDCAIVTGGGQGIGFDIARHLMANGANVVILDIAGDIAEKATIELNAEFPSRRAIEFVGDVADEHAIVAAFDLAEQHFGIVRLLYNNAGISELRPIVRCTVAEWRRINDVIALGTFLGTREFARRMLQHGESGGAIVSTSSLNFEFPSEGIAPYCAAKAAVSMFTKSAAVELAPLEIRVNAIAPGVIKTPLAASMILDDPALRDAFVSRTPLGRLGLTEDVARVAMLLSSKAAGWMTGLTIPVDGGTHMRGLFNYWEHMAPLIGLPEPAPAEWS